MEPRTPAPLEIETLAELDAHFAEHDLANVVLQGLALEDRDEILAGLVRPSTVFLGCSLGAKTRDAAERAGALVFPRIDGLPYSPYRNRLYTAEDLYGGFDPTAPETYERTVDSLIYRHWLRTGGARPDSIGETLARRLHDHGITDALYDFLDAPQEPRRVVAIMGGHSLGRDTAAYAAAARLARALTRRGYLMTSGGGPGAMEATHLGAWFAGHPDAALDEALTILPTAPRYDDPDWLARGFEVRARWPLSAEDAARYPSLGIPTWLYGHEPPNPFATHIAKYFANSVREDGLITIATGGIVYTPGSAGTIQEIFQDACQNHYESVGAASPMIFFGVDYWQREKPVYPLMQLLAAGRPYDRWLTITDEIPQVVALLERYSAAGLR